MAQVTEVAPHCGVKAFVGRPSCPFPFTDQQKCTIVSRKLLGTVMITRFLGAALVLACVLLQVDFTEAAGKKTTRVKEPSDPAMTFTVVRSSVPGCEPNCPQWIAAEGRIARNTGTIFKKFLAKLGKQRLPIIITSPGGDVDSALAMGQMIRARKLDVAVGGTYYAGCGPITKDCKLPKEQNGIYRGTATTYNAYCVSACPFILAGGQRRLAGSGGYVGVHQITTQPSFERVRYYETYRMINGRKKVLSRKIISRKKIIGKVTTKLGKSYDRKLAAYLVSMDIKPDMLNLLQLAKPADMHYLSRAEMTAINLVTDFDYAGTLVDGALCKKPAPAANCIVDRSFKVTVVQPSTVVTPVTKAPAFSGSAMNFAIVRSNRDNCEPSCVEWIYADGKILVETPSKFEEFLNRQGTTGLPIVIRSNGGDTAAAIELGRIIRKRGKDVEVGAILFAGCSTSRFFCRSKPDEHGRNFGSVDMENGRCDFACVVALAAGTHRSANASLKIRLSKTEMRAQIMNGSLSAYFHDMGINNMLLLFLNQTPQNEFLDLGFAQMQDTNLVQSRADHAGILK